MEKIPTHLTCPWCPAQAFPRGLMQNLMQAYECPAQHEFYILHDFEEGREEQ
jgi:hypothetical protein